MSIGRGVPIVLKPAFHWTVALGYVKTNPPPKKKSNSRYYTVFFVHHLMKGTNTYRGGYYVITPFSVVFFGCR